jgi:hypothetical protein
MGSELESARARVVNLELEPIRSYFRTGRSDEGLDEPNNVLQPQDRSTRDTSGFLNV